MKNELFAIEELEGRFEMEMFVLADGTVVDGSTAAAAEAENSACCEKYTCIGEVSAT